MLRRRLLALAAAVLLCSPAALAADDLASRGRALLDGRGCLACHSLDGSASVGPTLHGLGDRATPEGIRRSIVDPAAKVVPGYVKGVMPAMPLSEAELDAVVAALSEPVPPEEAPRQGSIRSVAIGAVLFVALHLLLSSGWVRPRLVAAIGEAPFQGVYSLLVGGALTWTWFAWKAAPYVELWPQLPWARWVPNAGMPFVALLAFAGYTTKSPTIAGMDSALGDPDPARGVLRISRHPANTAFALWGVLHLFPNGDVASVLLFGSVIALGVLGTWHIERRRRQRHGDAWLRYAAATSVVPFAAILAGRQRLDWREIGLWRIALGLATWVGLLLAHRLLIGASPFPVLG